MPYCNQSHRSCNVSHHASVNSRNDPVGSSRSSARPVRPIPLRSIHSPCQCSKPLVRRRGQLEDLEGRRLCPAVTGCDLSQSASPVWDADWRAQVASSRRRAGAELEQNRPNILPRAWHMDEVESLTGGAGGVPRHRCSRWDVRERRPYISNEHEKGYSEKGSARAGPIDHVCLRFMYLIWACRPLISFSCWDTFYLRILEWNTFNLRSLRVTSTHTFLHKRMPNKINSTFCSGVVSRNM